MASTENLGIDKISGGDYVNPDVFNTAFDKIDALGVDYVTEQGKSGEWWYRKWKSGRAECGVGSKSFGSQTLQPWGAIYSTFTGMSFGAYPFAFSSEPAAFVSSSNTNSQVYFGITYFKSSTPTTISPSIDIWRATDGDTGDVKLSIYVVGSYK